MLEILRNMSKTWVAKALLIMLVGSFGIWGVHSSMFATTSNSVVTVGDQKVSDTEFQIAFNGAMSSLSQRFGMQLNLEQAKAFGVESLVLNRLVSGAALDQLAANMKLGLSEDRLLQLIQEEPAFKDASGAFSKAMMEQRLANARIRQQDYVTSKSREAVRTQIADALASGYAAPKALTDALAAHSSETRSVDYLLLSNANIEPIKPPAEDVLAKWFEANKGKYQAPEYRKITYVKLEPADIADAVAISDAQVKEDYEKRKDSYRTPETRTIEQLAFTDKAAADAASAKLAAGTTFDQLVTEQGKTATDVLLGDFTKDKMPSAKMAEAAFSTTADGAVTPVVDGLLGPVILRVTNIRPEVVKSLDEVKDEIRKELALVLANDEIQSVYDRFEDTRASGASLAEAAKQLQLKAVPIDAVDAEGNDMKGVEIKDIPSEASLVAEAFKTEVGVEPLPITLKDGGYVWFELQGVTPARDRKIEEVKDKVVADWTAEQQQAALTKKSEEIVEQLRKGTKIADVATSLAIAVENKTGIKRSTEDAALSTAAVQAAFGGPVGFATSAAGSDDTSRIVLQVTEVNSDVATDALDGAADQNKALAASAGDEILDQLVNELQTEFGVSLNRTLANQLMVRQ